MNEYQKLASILALYQKHYDLGEPLVSDQVYDALYKQLQSMESTAQSAVKEGDENTIKTRSRNKAKDSPTQVIGYTADDRPTIKHFKPMLSLEHEFGVEGVDLFYQRIERFLKRRAGVMIAQPKVDGVSIALRYKNGVLAGAALRGNGIEGEDITANILCLNIPTHFDLCEQVQGELYIPNSTFKAQHTEQFATPRHAVAGSVRLLDVKEFARRGVKLLVHGFAGLKDKSIKSYTQAMKALSEVFDTVPCSVCADAQQARDYFQTQKELDYDADGCVFKVDDLTSWNVLGYSAKAPRYAFAVKSNATGVTSEVEEVQWSVGRTGVVTPVLKIAPVNIDGIQVSRASLHNLSEFNRYKPGRKDLAVVKRSGDVIPTVIEVIKMSDDRFAPPENCPSCNGILIAKDKTLLCSNGWYCPEQVVDRIQNLLWAFDIKGLGGKKIEFLHSLGMIKTFADIFDYPTWTWLAEKPGWGDKSFQKIRFPSSVTFEQFLLALGIDGVGKSVALKLSRYIQDIKELTRYDLKQIEGIGEIVANNITNFVKQNQYHIEQLSQVLTIEHVKIQDSIKAVLTGTFSMSKQALKQLSGGVLFGDSVNKNTQILVYGDKPGSKLAKAQKLQAEGHDIKIMNEREWLDYNKHLNS